MPLSIAGRKHVNDATAVMALGLGGLAVASQAVAEPAPMEEITVIGKSIGVLRLGEETTAGSRLGLSSLATPASVNTITREEILAKGDYGALEAVTRSPGLTATANPGNGGQSLSSRGFNGPNSTVYTYDGTRLFVTAGSVTFPADTATLERVEVLHGAGSVINGIGAVGATINYVPKSPVFGETPLEALLATGSFGMQRLSLGGGGELSDTWAYRLDGAWHDEGGYVDRAEEQRRVLAASLLFQPSDDLSARFSVDYADIEAAPYWGTPLINGAASEELREQNYNFGNGFVDYEDLWARVRTDWAIAPTITFRNDTYALDVRREWQNLEEYAYNDATNEIDRSFYLGIVHDQQQVGTRSDVLFEMNWGGMASRLTIGAEFNTIDLDYLNNFNTGAFDVADSVPVFGFDPGVRPPSIPTILDYSTDSNQYAFFFDNVLEISDHLSLVIGGRYDNFDFERYNHPLAVTGRPASEFDSAFSAFTWRAGIVYRPTPSLSLYAQTSTAADPVTSPASINLSNSGFDLSTGQQHEIGIKQQFMDGRAEYAIAWFDIVKDDLVTTLPGSLTAGQIGRQSSNGLEFSFRANPIGRLQVDFNAAFADAEFDDFYSGGISLAGNTPDGVPETSANLWLNWSLTQPVQIGAGARYVDQRFTSISNTETLPAYTVFDAYVNWAVTENTAVVLRGRNLTDEDDYVLSNYGSNQWVFGDPRAYELSFRYRR